MKNRAEKELYGYIKACVLADKITESEIIDSSLRIVAWNGMSLSRKNGYAML